ncbi:MAG: polyprenyl synthetase [Ignavibacteriae bacterium HGW-Ignavibacteriae-2]|nr:MAG: polyprenyl synthetase [Ignavibacteriae bacterium HGW-Ignavibacteriae-2]
MNKLNLSNIQKPIIEELSHFDSVFKNNLKSDVILVDLVARYIIKQKGKRIRPILVLLSAKLAGGITERSYRGAALVELLHTATLVHDDVVDGAEKRRSFPSINAIWKNKIAVLMGDYLLSRGLMIAVENNDFDFLKTITNTVKRMSEGELLQMSKTRKLNINEETYFRIISDKTASLLSTCCEIGALSSTNNADQISALKNFGEYLGLSFQIRDDILDYIGNSKIIGKNPGRDIKDKKITLPLIYALRNADKNESSKIIRYVKDGEKNKKVEEVIDFVKQNGGLEYAEKVAFEYSQKAKDSLKIFQSSESYTSLESLVDFVVSRKN